MIADVPDNVAQRNFGFVSRIAAKILALWGWRVVGHFPNERKFILAVAPHTSNWDFIVAMLVMLALNINVTFMGKNTIFIGPLKWLLESLGGVAIDRANPHGIVGQMSALFATRDKMILGLAPEGTRSKTLEWKKGFLYIALQAKVPVVPIGLDFSKKEVQIMQQQHVDDDIDASLQRIKSLFSGVCAKNPHLV